MIIRKNNFTLLEVLIGFLLILIALVPLFAPYPFMLKQQQAMKDQLEMDRLASIYYVDLLEKILKKDLSPSPGEILPVGAPLKMPYRADYRFGVDEVTISFTSLKGKEPYLFTYTLKNYDN